LSLRRPQSALLSKYLAMYRRQPGSRVFAPLAESYRKLGMLEEAFKILKEGIKRHPGYVLGYLVLAQCYYDQKKIDLTYQTLHPLVENNRDNLSLQKLFGQVCLDLGLYDEALQTYKFLLFINPKDAFFAEQVRRLENDRNKENLIPKNVIIKSPEQKKSNERDEDDWSIVSFSNKSEQPVGFNAEESWVVEKNEASAPASVNEDDWQVMSRSIDDDYFSDDEVSPEDSDIPEEINQNDDTFFANHTLVDLYLSQDYTESAIDLLEKIIQMHPHDQKSIQKLKEIKSSKTNQSESGHEEILRIIESQVHKPDNDRLQQAYRLFLQHIQLHADEKSSQA
jgi:tetratricopeptide (TPR) repeat protein